MDKDYIQTVASIVIPYENGFVYVKTAKDGKWGLPGGKLDPFEEINIGLTREVKEETNLGVILTYFLGVWDFKSDRGHPISNRVLSGRVVDGQLKINRLDEIMDLRALSLSDIRQLCRQGEVRGGRANLEPVEEFLRDVKYPINLVHTLF